MPNKRLYLHLVTLWHPDKFLGIEQAELSKLPAISRERETLERHRQEAARQMNVEISYDIMHGGKVSHTGKAVYSLRKTWIPGKALAKALDDFDVRLINTDEQRSQARSRCEFRPDWSTEPADWTPDLRRRILEGIRCTAKVSVRSLWRNPVKARFGKLPLQVPEDSVTEIANLVLGPFEPESIRKASVAFEKNENVWWIIY